MQLKTQEQHLKETFENTIEIKKNFKNTIYFKELTAIEMNALSNE